MVTAEEAQRRGWWTMRQFAEWAKRPVVSVYDMVDKEGFPQPVGLVPSKGPNPHRMREADALKNWFRARVRRSKWTDSADEISPQKARARRAAVHRGAQSTGDVLSLTEVCDAAGLKPSTIKSYVHRTGRPVRGAVAHLARPAYRVGATPYWSQAQLDAYFEAVESQAAAQGDGELVEVTAEEAEQRVWWSIPRLAEWAGFKLAHMYRMANEEGFPQPIAVVPSNGPNPIKVRDRAQVEAWFRARRPDWEPAAVQDARSSR